jgi:hypothetical protein
MESEDNETEWQNIWKKLTDGDGTNEREHRTMRKIMWRGFLWLVQEININERSIWKDRTENTETLIGKVRKWSEESQRMAW